MLDRRLWSEALACRTQLLLTILLGGLTGVITVGQAYLLSRIVDRVYLQGQGLDDLSHFLVPLVLVISGRSVLAWLTNSIAGTAAASLVASLRRRLVTHLFGLGPGYGYGQRTGELANTVVEGFDALDAYFGRYLPQLAISALVPLIILVVVFPADWPSALVLLLTAPLIPLFMILIGRAADVLANRQWKVLSLLSAHFLDVLQGLATLKQLGQGKNQATNIERTSRQFRDVTLGVLRVAFLSALALELLSTISVAIIAVTIGLRLLAGNMAFVDALFVLILAPEFYLPLRLLGQRYHDGRAGVAAASRIFAILETGLPPGPVEPGSVPQLPQTIRFEEVYFAYDRGDRPALKGVSFEIPAGQKVALVGPSGAGKSTIAGLLLGFATPDKGRITIGSRSLAGVDPAAWREQVAWLPQQPTLFHDTVAANIHLARPDATLTEIEAAAHQAQADEFIRALPNGYETIIGERGTRLSRGQSTRLALARAYLKDAPFLILDEPAANLDPESERLMRQATARLLHDRAGLVIAHRLTTVYEAGQILLVEDGRITDRGTHQELVSRCPRYRQWVEMGGGNRGSGIGDWGSGTGTGEVEPRPTTDVSSLTDPPTRTPATRHLPPATRRARQRRARPFLQPMPITPLPSPLLADPPTRTPATRPLANLLKLLAPYKSRIALSVLLGALTVGSGVALLATSAWLISAAALRPSIADLGLAIVGVRFFGLSRGIFRYLERLVSHSVTFCLLARLRVWFYEALEPLAPAILSGYRGGDLLGRAVSDIESLQPFYVRVVGPPLVAVVVTAAMAAYLATFDARLALVLILFMLLAGLGLPLLIRRLSARPGSQLVALRASLLGSLVESLQGLADLLVYGSDGRAHDAIVSLVGHVTGQNKRLAWIDGLQEGLSVWLANSALVAVLILAIPQVAAGRLDGVYLAGLALATVAAFEAVNPLPQAARQLAESKAAATRLFALADSKPAVVDPPHPAPPPGTAGLQARDLRFRYSAAGPWVLDGIYFDLPPGKRLAVVGPSGAGKTTLANILYRFWPYAGGSLLLDGVELREYAQDGVRRLFTPVAQDGHLFNATIDENIRIARPGAGREAVIAAAEKAQLHAFIETLPQGYETRVGQLGFKLSGGQRQRLLLARAFLHDGPLWLLDEPTANLDPLAEQAILRAILAPIPAPAVSRSLLLITHRLVGMEQMDEILVLDGGRIVQRGRHEDLVRQGGLYARLWRRQREAVEGAGE